MKWEFIEYFGEYPAASLFAQLLYWHGNGKNGKPRMQYFRDGFLWVAKARQQIADESQITLKQYIRVSRKLQGMGLLHVDHRIFAGKRVCVYRLDIPNCLAFLSKLPFGNSGDCPKGSVEAALKAASLQKTLTENLITEEPANAKAIPMNIEDKLKAFGQAKNEIKHPLALHWTSRMAAMSGSFQKPLSNKERAQLKKLGEHIGLDRARKVIDMALENWLPFTWQAKQAKNLDTIPGKPMIGFLLAHLDCAVQLIAPAVIVQQAQPPEKPGVLPLPALPEYNQEPPQQVDIKLLAELQELAKESKGWG